MNITNIKFKKVHFTRNNKYSFKFYKNNVYVTRKTSQAQDEIADDKEFTGQDGNSSRLESSRERTSLKE